MKTLVGNNIPAAPPYTYDATSTHCSACTYNALYDYDDTRRANSRTSSTAVTTTFHGEAVFEDSGGLFEDASGGYEQDTAGIGMSLYGYRYYNPDLGRWVNRDPIGELGSFLPRDDPYGMSEMETALPEMEAQIARFEDMMQVFEDFDREAGGQAAWREELEATEEALSSYRILVSIVRNRLVEDPRWIGLSGMPYQFVGNRSVDRTDFLGLLDSVSCWHRNCMKRPTKAKRCECHCAYAGDGTTCEKLCKDCWGGKGKPDPYKLCMCTCKAAGQTDLKCKIICKVAKKKKK